MRLQRGEGSFWELSPMGLLFLGLQVSLLRVLLLKVSWLAPFLEAFCIKATLLDLGSWLIM